VSRLHLSVVSHGDELKGTGPRDFERLARSAAKESAAHRGLVIIVATLARRCATTSVPPRGQVDLLAGVEAALLWTQGKAGSAEVARARRNCFGAVTALEDMTAQAVQNARALLPSGAATPLDRHADHVVERYARLAAHFSTSAVCHALDAVENPETALEVPGDIEGARAYQAAGLGSARQPAFRRAAWDQAEWESRRAAGTQTESLALQVFHEYLGGRWRTHADAERERNNAFITWALGGLRRPA
jgi:hypothetical protein